MNEKLYPLGQPLHDDTKIIVELIENVVPKEVDVLFTCTSVGVLATMHLRPPHQASWNITWTISKPMILDTGDEGMPYPCIADPACKDIVTEQLARRYKEMHRFCDCQRCRPSL